jgi:cytidylate kinase
MRRSTPRSLDELVASQVQQWQREEALRSAHAPPPCVAFSRLPGAGGAAVGKRTAEILGFGFFGIEIVDQIAREQGVRRDLVAGLDEHVRAAIDRWVGDGVRRAPFTETQYHEALLRTLGTLSERGRVVILGRGSPYALPQGRTLRVWVVASRAYRRERLGLVRGLEATAAERQLDREEFERQSFIQHHFRVDPDDASLYDVVVNTETLGIERAARVVARTFDERFAGAAESSGRAAQSGSSAALQAG